MKEKPCSLHGFYDLVYYELVSQENRHRSELKNKASSSLSLKKKSFFSKIAGRDSQQLRINGK